MKKLLRIVGWILFAIWAVIFVIAAIAFVILRNIYGPPVD